MIEKPANLHHPRRPWGQTVVLAVVLVILGACSSPDTTDDDVASGLPEGPSAADSGGDGRASGEEVTIPAEGLDLVGTLRLPAGEAPFPAVVIVHGSGPQSRQGRSPGQLGLTLPRQVPVYEQLAEGLQAAGFAVLTWDKRTCGPFNGCADNGYPAPPEDLAFTVFAEDVAAVLDHLGARADIGEVAVVGHSKGGTVATQLLDRDDVAALALVAVPAVPIDAVLAAQAETLTDLVAAAGQQGTAADQVVAEVRDLADDVRAIASGAVDGPPVGGVDRRFWQGWIDASRQAPDLVAQSGVPVLVLGGAQDWNVLPDQVEAWAPFLDDADEVRILDGITHALTRLDGDDPADITPADVGTDVDPEVIQVLADWLGGL